MRFAVERRGPAADGFSDCFPVKREQSCCEKEVELLKFLVAFCLCFMKHPTKNFQEFIKTPLGTVLVFVILFYIITFAVYYFYSPGPEERRQAELDIQNRMQSQQISDTVGGMTGQENVSPTQAPAQ